MKHTKNIKIFLPFRAFHNLQFNYRITLFFLLPFLFNVLVLLSLNPILNFWANLFKFFLTRMGDAENIAYLQYHIFGVAFLLPYLTLTADAPSNLIWWNTLIFSFIVFLLSTMTSDSYLPLKYLLRTILFIIAISLLFFSIYPANFPYNIEIYSKTGLLQILGLMFSIPWLFCFTYYVLGYKFINKILVTLLALIFFTISGPMQYLLNSYIIHTFSLLFMPVLYLFFGLLINIFVIIAFYAYGVSLE